MKTEIIINNDIKIDVKHPKVMLPTPSDFNDGDYCKGEERSLRFETDNWEFDGEDDFFEVITVTGKSFDTIIKAANKWAKKNGWKIDWQ